MPIIQFQKEHGGAAFIASEGVIAESMEDGRTPFIKAAKDMMFFTGYCPKQFFVDIPVPGINTAITYHFEMFFRDMLDQTLDEFKGRNHFCHILIVFMPVVMESDVSTVIVVNTRSSNDRSAKIPAKVFGHYFWVTLLGFGVDIEAVFVVFIAGCFHFFKRRTETGLQFIKESSTEGIAEKRVIEMFYIAPVSIITVAAL